MDRITAIPVPGFVAPTAGEHPRLYLRKSEIPQLRAAAQTDRGKEVIQGLLNLVHEGTKVGPPPLQNYGAAPRPFDMGGAYESSAYAVLYQITGEGRYADLSRQAIERYYLPEYAENYKLTYSADQWMYGYPLNIAVAELMSYDLCYDAWTPEFRKQVAERLGRMGAVLAARPGEEEPFDPAASVASPEPWVVGDIHPGETIGKSFAALGYKGMGMPRQIFVSQVLLLGLKGDPEAPQLPWDTLLDKARERFERLVPAAFGEHGRHRQFKLWGWMVIAEFQLQDSLLAWRNAGGLDYTQDERVRWLHLQWIPELLQRQDGGYWIRRHEGDSLNQGYGYLPHSTRWNNFPDAFVLLTGKDQGAMLWSWNHTIKPGFELKPPEWKWDFKGQPYMALSVLLHWPDDKAEVNPAEVLPRPYVDHDVGSVVFRNHWKDENDVVIDCWIGGSDDWRNPVVLWARGKRTTLGFLGVSKPEYGVIPSKPPMEDKDAFKAWRDTVSKMAFDSGKAGPHEIAAAPEPSADGSGSASFSYGNAIAVDFSVGGREDVLVAMTGPGVDGLPDSGGVIRPGPRNEKWDEDFGPLASDTMVTVGERKIRITLIGDGPHPQATVVGDTVHVGNRIVSFTEKGLKITVAK